MSGAIKRTTGLTGLAVSKNPHHVLTALYNKTMRSLAKMPENAVYRKNTEQIVASRANLVASTPNVAELEKKIGCGQIEEVIVQAENELQLARKMLGWKPWESLIRSAPPAQWQWPPAQIKSITK